MLENVIIMENWSDMDVLLTSHMNSDEPIFFSRVGGSDTTAVKQYFEDKKLINNEVWVNTYLNIVKMYNGYFDFDNNIGNFQKFLEDMILYYKNSDNCSYAPAGYIQKHEGPFIDYVLEGKTVINYGFIECVKPFLKSFMNWGKNKKILIVSPLSKSVEYQFKNKDNLYLNYKFPEFELKTYNTKITYNTSGDTKESLGLTTNNWHEECQRLAEEIKNIDFDVALLSCASYAMFLGNYIKFSMGKKAIYLGGVLNVYFNIYGGRFSQSGHNSYYDVSGLNPEYQIDPFENEDIENIKGGRKTPSEALNAYFGKSKKK